MMIPEFQELMMQLNGWMEQFAPRITDVMRGDSSLSRAQRIAAEVRARHPEMQVRKSSPPAEK